MNNKVIAANAVSVVSTETKMSLFQSILFHYALVFVSSKEFKEAVYLDSVKQRLRSFFLGLESFADSGFNPEWLSTPIPDSFFKLNLVDVINICESSSEHEILANKQGIKRANVNMETGAIASTCSGLPAVFLRSFNERLDTINLNNNIAVEDVLSEKNVIEHLESLAGEFFAQEAIPTVIESGFVAIEGTSEIEVKAEKAEEVVAESTTTKKVEDITQEDIEISRAETLTEEVPAAFAALNDMLSTVTEEAEVTEVDTEVATVIPVTEEPTQQAPSEVTPEIVPEEAPEEEVAEEIAVNPTPTEEELAAVSTEAVASENIVSEIIVVSTVDSGENITSEAAVVVENSLLPVVYEEPVKMVTSENVEEPAPALIEPVIASIIVPVVASVPAAVVASVVKETAKVVKLTPSEKKNAAPMEESIANAIKNIGERKFMQKHDHRKPQYFENDIYTRITAAVAKSVKFEGYAFPVGKTYIPRGAEEKRLASLKAQLDKDPKNPHYKKLLDNFSNNSGKIARGQFCLSIEGENFSAIKHMNNFPQNWRIPETTVHARIGGNSFVTITLPLLLKYHLNNRSKEGFVCELPEGEFLEAKTPILINPMNYKQIQEAMT